jgi:hypothetical protein
MVIGDHIMLTQILRRAQAFERRHGRKPNTLFLTQAQYYILRQEYPEILGASPQIALGLRIALVPDLSLLQPEIAWVPPSAPEYLRSQSNSKTINSRMDEHSGPVKVISRN